jgi:exodeoxyribonuclease-5
MQLSDEQGRAVKRVADRSQWRNGHAWLAGYAGSGKTSIAPFIVEAFGAQRPLYCAPTNKAAKVLSRKVDKQAISLHKAIYYPPEESPRGELGWVRNPGGPAACADLIVVDEASMVGTEIGADLMAFGVPVIAIGDPGQLPPINDTPFFCVGEPDYLLTEIHRQARDNPIIALSQDVREGKRLRPGTMGDAVRIVRPGQVEIPDENVPQVITGTHRRRWTVTDAIRSVLGYEGWLPNPGEKLVCRKNSKTHGELTNGEEAVAVSFQQDPWEPFALEAMTSLNPNDEPYRVWDGMFREHMMREALRPEWKSDDWISQKQNEAFDFGWAVTCHVAQGSQWDDVIVYDEGYVFRQDAARWTYTAVTRAAERLTVIV